LRSGFGAALPSRPCDLVVDCVTARARACFQYQNAARTAPLRGRALAKAGLPSGLHVHDLRHTGNTLTAEAGASVAELMNRMEHSSTRAAQVYSHAQQARDQQLAATLDRMAHRERKRSARMPAPTDRAWAAPEAHKDAGDQRADWLAELPTLGLERVTRIELALSAWESATASL
jgi:hypothetical protein